MLNQYLHSAIDVSEDEALQPPLYTHLMSKKPSDTFARAIYCIQTIDPSGIVRHRRVIFRAVLFQVAE